jgi:CRP/FNR family transcriptional regulator, cyclic AMP receptor protein
MGELEMTGEVLSNVALLSTLSTEQRQEIWRAAVHQNVAELSILINEQDDTADIFFLLSGRVAVKSFSETGHEVSYIELVPGACFGEFSAIDGGKRAATVEALTPVSVIRLSRSRFRGFIEKFPALGLALAEHLVARSRSLSERIFEFSTLPVRSRIHLELLRLARRADHLADRIAIQPAPTHQELAARISTHREAVSREIAALEAGGYVKAGRRTIEIISIKALRQLANG